jgi:hypothetical protein
MNKALTFVVFVAFIFSSCATAPVVNPNQKLSAHVRVYPFAYLNGGYPNAATLAFKDYSGFKILDAKAAESTDGTGSNTEAKQSPTGYNLLAGVLAVGVLALGGYFLYDSITNPDSLLNK